VSPFTARHAPSSPYASPHTHCAQATAAAADDDVDDVVAYLKVKQQMLLAYCASLTLYLYMKVRTAQHTSPHLRCARNKPSLVPARLRRQVQGESVRDHPVMRRLLELRYAMEKMRAMDGKMKHQIDRLMKQSAGAPTALRPNLANLVPRDGDDDDDDGNGDEEEDEEEDEDDEDGNGGGRRGRGGKGTATGLYKAPKMAAVPYRENEAHADREAQRMQRRKKKLSNSEIMETLREEFGTAPEAASSSGLSKVSVDQRRLQEEADERRNFEEERFVRLVRCPCQLAILPTWWLFFSHAPMLAHFSHRCRPCRGKKSNRSRNVLPKRPVWTTSTTLATWRISKKSWSFQSGARACGTPAAAGERRRHRRHRRWEGQAGPPEGAVPGRTRLPGRCSAR